MAAQRTPAEGMANELLRQSERIQEQLVCLGRILDVSTSNLGNMTNMLAPYSKELADEVFKLKTSIENYKSKANSIYGDVAGGLKAYAVDLMNNLTELQESVKAITQAVESL